ncbi:hypothetical protein ACFLRF_06400 [Candidatus Altiarchaeota archaeon]
MAGLLEQKAAGLPVASTQACLPVLHTQHPSPQMVGLQSILSVNTCESVPHVVSHADSSEEHVATDSPVSSWQTTSGSLQRQHTSEDRLGWQAVYW